MVVKVFYCHITLGHRALSRDYALRYLAAVHNSRPAVYSTILQNYYVILRDTSRIDCVPNLTLAKTQT